MFRDFESSEWGGPEVVPILHLVTGEPKPQCIDDIRQRSIASIPWDREELIVSMTVHTSGTGNWVALVVPGAMWVKPASYPILAIKGQTVTVDIRRTDRRS